MFALRLRKLACAVAALGIGGSTAFGQQPTTAATSADARADTAFQQRSWQAAADAYGAIAKAQPNNGMAWFRLATSLDQLLRAKEAIDAYDHAVRLGFQRARAEYRMAVLYATSGDSKTAMDHLTSVAPMLPDPTMLDKEPAFASLRAMPEFGAIKQKAEAARFPCRTDHTFDFWVGDFTA